MAAVLLKDASEFIIFRFPLLSAVTLTKLCWERYQDYWTASYPQWYIYTLYIYIAVLFACGITFFTSRRYKYANVTVVSMTTMAVITVAMQSLQNPTKAWMVVKVASHDVGVIGVFLIMASHAREDHGKGNQFFDLIQNFSNRLADIPAPLLAPLIGTLGTFNVALLGVLQNMGNHAVNADRGVHLHYLSKYGKILVSIFCIISAVQLYTVREDQQALLNSYPNCHVAMAILGVTLLLGGFALCSEWQTKRISGLVAVALVCYLLTIDGNLQYWHSKQYVEYWLQMNMILSSATVVCALAFMSI